MMNKKTNNKMNQRKMKMKNQFKNIIQILNYKIKTMIMIKKKKNYT